METPKFSDLDEDAKNLFEKGFGLGEVKVDFSKFTKSGMFVLTSHTKENATENITGDLFIQHKKDRTTFTHNLLTQNIMVESIGYNHQTEGLYTELEFTYVGIGGRFLTSKVNVDYKKPQIRMTGSTDILGGNEITCAGVVHATDKIQLGVEGGYNTSTGTASRAGLAAAYKAGVVSACLCTDMSQWTATLQRQISGSLVAGTRLVYSPSQGKKNVDVAAQCSLKPGTSIKAKLTHDGQLSVGYTTRFFDIGAITMGIKLDGKAMSLDKQSVGVALSLSG